MRESFRVKLLAMAVVATVPLAGLWPASAQDVDLTVPVPEGTRTATPDVPATFVGTWDYNPLESINILTGRPEQAPRSATQGSRGGAAVPAPRGGGTGTVRGGGGIPGDGGGRGGGGLGLGPTPQMMREARDMSRDLLEIAEQYHVRLSAGRITFIDDLERERTYPLDGSKNKYRLGASEFNARVSWTGTQLRKEIEGSFGFRMTETYFLSPDGRRLFLMVRVGQASRNRQPSGFNRVYDRVESTLPASTEAASQ